MKHVPAFFGALASAFLTRWLFSVHGDALVILALSSTVGALGGSWGYERWKRRRVPLV